MQLTYLIDEHLRGAFREALFREGVSKGFVLDLLQVGDEGAPPTGTQDPDLLVWCNQVDRIMVSYDRNTMPEHFAALLATGGTSSGLFLIRPGVQWQDILAELVLRAVASLPDEYREQIIYIPWA